MANIARAKAKKAAKDTLVRQQLKLGQSAAQAGLETAADVAAAALALRLLEAWFGPEGPVKIGEKRHFEALAGLPRAPMADVEWGPLTSWWSGKDFPAKGGE